jgi:hypothetical protein
VGLERGPLSLVSTTEELLGRKHIGSGLESRKYGRNPYGRHADNVPPRILQKLPLTSPTSGGRSVGIVRSRTKDTEFNSPLLGFGCFFSFLIHYTVGRIPWTGDQPVASPRRTYRTT